MVITTSQIGRKRRMKIGTFSFLTQVPIEHIYDPNEAGGGDGDREDDGGGSKKSLFPPRVRARATTIGNGQAARAARYTYYYTTPHMSSRVERECLLLFWI